MYFELKGVVMFWIFDSDSVNWFFFSVGLLLALGAVGWFMYARLLFKFDAQSGYVRRLEGEYLGQLGDDMDFLYERVAELDNSSRVE